MEFRDQQRAATVRDACLRFKTDEDYAHARKVLGGAPAQAPEDYTPSTERQWTIAYI